MFIPEYKVAVEHMRHMHAFIMSEIILSYQMPISGTTSHFDQLTVRRGHLNHNLQVDESETEIDKEIDEFI